MFYLLDKPKGISSFQAIRAFAKQNSIAKIGHTGTLDPLASGLLLVATDEDTKLIDYVDKGFKTYKASMILGKTSDTYDIEGEITEVTSVLPSKEEVEKALKSFVGKISQMPPAFSAKKINGQKAYDLARQGQEVTLKAVEVEIKDITNFEQVSQNEYQFEVTVSRGTYIRSLIHDVGQKLECGAIMSDLVRTSIGKHSLEQKNKQINILDLLTVPIIEIDNLKDLMHGKSVDCKAINGIYALKVNEDVFGIIEVSNNKAKAVKLLGNKFKKAGL